jgi:hypothetical protein
MVQDQAQSDLDRLLERVPGGWSRQEVDGRSWGVSRVEHVDGRSTTVTAEQLGGSLMFSANVWHTSHGAILRPCEVPAETVLDFLENLPASARTDSETLEATATEDAARSPGR